MKKLLLDVFGYLKEEFPDFQVVGRKVLFSLDEERYAKIEFSIYATSRSARSNYYKGCKIKILSRSRGKLDSHMVSFEDVFEYVENYIWGNNWDKEPTEKELQDFRDAVSAYLNLMYSPKVLKDKLINKTIV